MSSRPAKLHNETLTGRGFGETRKSNIKQLSAVTKAEFLLQIKISINGLGMCQVLGSILASTVLFCFFKICVINACLELGVLASAYNLSIHPRGTGKRPAYST